ncbi:MAG: translation elongation factor 4 [Bacilli bacterium]|jgi:GTP-binding protein LepA
MQQQNFRNFAIIAHIDHGKSTLADRILEITDAISERDRKEQLLDNMDIERERGITIKLNAVQLKYRYQGVDYYLHLIDTPGHVDFSYEVSRSLAACEGAVLVVDAAQGIQAQTLANVYLAKEHNLVIIPVINKIDLPNADIDKVKQELIELLGCVAEDILLVSAKTGHGVEELIKTIINRLPYPKGDAKAPLQALIFDSFFDLYRGAVSLIRVVNGELAVGDQITLMNTNKQYTVEELGINTPTAIKKDQLVTGEVGWVTASIKALNDIKVGDTITHSNKPATQPLPGYQMIKSMVFCGLYPIDSTKYNELREALTKLKLNDASFQFTGETSQALGFGFRCGFLGLLHMEIIKERLEREYNIDVITTSPSVIYELTLNNNEIITIDSPAKMPPRQQILSIKEPYIKTNIIAPSEYIGPVMELCQQKRGQYINIKYLNKSNVNIIYELPFAEIVYDFFDKLKSSTKGYASFDYELVGYKNSDLIKMDILLNSEVVDALSSIIHRPSAYARGKIIVEKLKQLIPRQQFEIPIQAVIGGKVIARTDIKAVRKNVTAKCYGGDITRKRKLLEKQKEGKKRMKQIGSVAVPQEAFLTILSTDE